MPRTHRRFELYPRNRSAQLDPKLFRNPTKEYRGTPFWSWNSTLDLPQLFRQIEQIRQMGFGGFHIHSRTGLASEYLGDEYLRAVSACTDRAAKSGLLSWLYDEDRWPSGFAGGIVTRDVLHRIKRLVWTKSARPDGVQLAKYQIALKDGCLESYRRVENDIVGCASAHQSPDADGVLKHTLQKRPKLTRKQSHAEATWYAYLESPPPDPWFNNQTNVDALSQSAIARFIEVTHERFFGAMKKHFGKTIPAIFTDEPQFTKKMTFQRADDTRDLLMPWTTDFAKTYHATYGHDILDHLPELFWSLPGDAPSHARYCYHDHTAERFAAAFGDQIGAWCAAHGIALTGHMLGEVHLFSQTRGYGEAMRGLRSFQLPGIDILCDRIEFTTAKQAQSVAHQRGAPGVLSELYGVTNWDYDFLGHKAQGDWQAAMGVTVRVPHLQWQSMAGESKRDYPAPIGYQSPWWREYPLIENHFSRINVVMSRGRPLVRVAVIHPIESYWLCFGSLEQNQREMEQREEQFRQLPEWLIYGAIDFDYISESSIEAPGFGAQGSGKTFRVGSMSYDVVVVPSLRTIRSRTLKALERFQKSGGTVVFAGEIPSLVHGKPSLAPSRLAKRCTRIAFAKREILQSLEPFRDVEIQQSDGSPADSIVYHNRIDGKRRHIFFCNMDRQSARSNVRILIRGKWNATLLDTMTGRTQPLHRDTGLQPVRGNAHGPKAHVTEISHDFAAAGHLLITLSPAIAKNQKISIPAPRPWFEISRLNSPVPITLSEPNVLLLDQAGWRIDDGEWQPVEEILRLDNLARQMLNLPLRGGRIAQPWADHSPAPIVAKLQLRFAFHSDIPVAEPTLALEDAANIEIHLNGSRVESKIVGWWVDESIQTVHLPAISPGEYELVLTIPFSRKTNVEWCYLLGDFGVQVLGRSAKLIAPPRTLSFGDWTNQGLPFYAGNVTYHCTIAGNGKPILIEVPKFKSPLLSVDLDEKLAGKIAFLPFQLELGNLSGEHKLDITAYGNRINAFGPIHNTIEDLKWVGPDAWRSTGTAWAYEYQLKRMGILSSPIVKTAE